MRNRRLRFVFCVRRPFARGPTKIRPRWSQLDRNGRRRRHARSEQHACATELMQKGVTIRRSPTSLVARRSQHSLPIPRLDSPTISAYQDTSFSGRISESDNLPLSGATVAIIGAGVGGLNAAIKLDKLGADVSVFEQRTDPRTATVRDSRSFNLTINEVGRAALDEPILCELFAEGQVITGRQVHSPNGGSAFYRYGSSPYDYFVSVPRHVLISILLAHVSGIAGVFFNTEVREIDPQSGSIVTAGAGQEPVARHFDLVVDAGGLHSRGKELLGRLPGTSLTKICLSTGYLQVKLRTEEVNRNHLRLDAVQFWPSSLGTSIGIPNRDGSLDLLAMAEFSQPFEAPIFANTDAAKDFLFKRSPALVRAFPTLPERLINKRRGSFVCASCARWWDGKLVLLGDAGRAMPPWAGLGANAALDDARTLAQCLLEAKGDLAAGLRCYSEDRVTIARLLSGFVSNHGRTLGGSIGSIWWRVAQTWLSCREVVTGIRTEYQRICFNPRGLSALLQQQAEEWAADS